MRTRTPLLATILLSMSALCLPPNAASADPHASPGPASSDPVRVPTAELVGARVQAFYNQTKTFQANFKQEYTLKMHNQKRASEGHVVFEKPGRMSWTYSEPSGNRVVSDGKVLKVYERENQQMFEQPVDKTYYPAALSFLMGQGQLTEAFELRLLDAAQMKFEGGYVLEAKPKDATPAYQVLILYVDAVTAQVRRVLILDAQGNRNRFDFVDPIVNTRVPAGEFTFTPPAGTQVVRP